MENVNTEQIISSLFCVGFDLVDPVLYTYVLANLDKDKFNFYNGEYSQVFCAFVDDSTSVFRIKFNLTLDYEIEYFDIIKIPLRKALPTNEKLIEYLNTLDYKDLVLKKAQAYEIDEYSTINRNLFSKKEIEILKELGYGKKTLYQKIKSIF